MKKGKLITATILLALGGAGTQIAISPNQVQAAKYYRVKQRNYSSRPYHAKDASQSAKIWNIGHTRAIGDLTDYSNTTWYANASVTMKHGAKKAIYYQVRSDDGKTTGYIWRGYLASGKYNNVTDIKDSNQYLFDSIDPQFFINSGYLDQNLNDQVAKLFPKTVQDKQVQLAAEVAAMPYFEQNSKVNQQVGASSTVINDLLGQKNAADIITVINNQTYQGTDQGLILFVKQQLEAELTKQNKQFTDFAGYRIGAYVLPKTNKDKNMAANAVKANYGKTLVYLVPPKAELPKLPEKVYYSNPATAVNSTQVNQTLNDELVKLFPGTNKNNNLQILASLGPCSFDPEQDGMDSYHDLLDGVFGEKNKQKVFMVTNVSHNKTHGSTQDVIKTAKEQLTEQLAETKKHYDDFKGYQIGAYIDVNPSSPTYGAYNILIKPANMKMDMKQISSFSFNR